MRKWKVGDKAKVTLPDGSSHEGEIVRKAPDGKCCVLEIHKDLEVLTEVEFLKETTKAANNNDLLKS